MEEVPAANSSDKSATGDQSSPSAAVTNTDNNSPSTTTARRSTPPLSKVKTEPAETVAFNEGAVKNCNTASRNSTEASMNRPQVKNEESTLRDDSADCDSGNEPHLATTTTDSASSATPLNLSVKKRRTDSTPQTTKDRCLLHQRSAFETVGRNGPMIGTPASSALSMALSSAPSPYVLNRLLPFSFLSTAPPCGGPNDIDMRTPNDHRPSSQDMLLGSYFGVSPTGKHQRPFKAYNPMDPMSALQISGLNLPLRHGNGTNLMPKGTSSSSSNGKTLSTAQYLTDQLLQPYRQYLQQMQQASSTPNPLSPLSTCSISSTGLSGSAAAAAVREKRGDHTCNSNNNEEDSSGSSPSRSVSLPQSTPTSTSCKQQHSPKQTNGAAPITPSPPEVTSTSHPHTESHHHHHNNNHHVNCRQLLAGRCLTSTSPSGSDTGASSGGMNSSTSPVTSEEPIDRPRESNNIGESQSDRSKLINGNSSEAAIMATQDMSRRKGRVLPETLKDEAYWERRRKNNEAAKRSRDARRAKEDEIAVRAALLEQENMRLRIEVAALKAETEKLRQMLLKG
ncbi:protein giant [Trichuris trichiura]|uniref:Protein giant n=1 Tax=Trichuris trichiura TaxID=36087 RepID=A0A077ZAT9_TRITR|nr:protein giant [Trichuris trichiura]